MSVTYLDTKHRAKFSSQMFHMPHTMNSIQLNQAASHHRVLKRFTQAVPRFSEKFESIIQKTLFRHLKNSQTITGDTSSESLSCVSPSFVSNEGWIEVSAYALSEALIGQVNFYSFFGDCYGKTPRFIRPRDLLQLIPRR